MDTPELLTHFNRLADAPGAIPRLRRLVLDLAVRGKLVAQDPGDEPASVLLERIAAERLKSDRKSKSPEKYPILDAEGGLNSQVHRFRVVYGDAGGRAARAFQEPPHGVSLRSGLANRHGFNGASFE